MFHFALLGALLTQVERFRSGDRTKKRSPLPSPPSPPSPPNLRVLRVFVVNYPLYFTKHFRHKEHQDIHHSSNNSWGSDRPVAIAQNLVISTSPNIEDNLSKTLTQFFRAVWV